jgi:predicted dehydrogenase
VTKVRLGFVGVGGMGQCAHLRNYVTLPDCEVTALAELREELGRKVAARYGIPRVYRDHREMLAQEKLDGIVAIQPFTIHGRLLPELFPTGTPVLSEKPLARSVDAGLQIVSALKASSARYYVAYHKRSDPATLFAKQQIDAWKQSGAMGAMKYLRITMPPGDWAAAGFAPLLRSDEPYPALETDPTPTGMEEATAKQLEAFVNYYIHQVNLMRYLFGEGYRVLYADPAGVLMAVLSESGVPGVLEMAPYRTTVDWQESVLATFEKGWIRLELPAPMVIDQPGRVTIYEDPGEGVPPREWSPTLPHVHAMRQQAIHFVKAVQGEPTCLCEPDDALADLQIAHDYIALFQAASHP